MPKELFVVHTNAQELIGEREELELSTSYVLSKLFVINREHIAMQENIATMLLLDSISEESVPINKELCSLIRKATKEEQKSYDNVRAQMSGLKIPSKNDLRLIKEPGQQ
jgi:predicted DNA-binding ribbon-helix-helix protein